MISVAPGDTREIDIIALGTTFFTSPGYGGSTSVLSDDQSAVAVVRFEDDDWALLKLSGLEGGLIVNSTVDGADINKPTFKPR